MERNIFRKTLQQFFFSCGFLFFVLLFQNTYFNGEVLKAVEQNQGRRFQVWICSWTSHLPQLIVHRNLTLFCMISVSVLNDQAKVNVSFSEARGKFSA